MSTLDKAIIAAARAHYVYVWHSAPRDPEAAAARWDGGVVEGGVMSYHGDHVRHQIEAAAPIIQAQALRDTADRYRGKAKALRELAGITKTPFPMAIDVLLDLADELDRDAAEMETR